MSDPAIEASDMVGYIPDDPVAYHYGIRVASEALAPIRVLHVSEPSAWTDQFGEHILQCAECEHPWPCATSRLVYSSEELGEC